MKPHAPPAPIYIRLIWRTIAFIVGLWAIHALFTKLEEVMGSKIANQYGSHFQFLTNLGLFVSVVAHCTAILSDLVPTSSILAKTKTFLAVVALPIEVLISILYWSILSISPDLLIPPKEQEDPLNPGQLILVSVKPPVDIDIAMHALPAFFLVIDHLFLSPPFPNTLRPSLVSASATIAYCIWIENCAAHNGSFPYPLINLLNLPQRIGLYGLCATIMVAVLSAVRALHTTLDQQRDREWGQMPGSSTSDFGQIQGKGKVGKVDTAKKQ